MPRTEISSDRIEEGPPESFSAFLLCWFEKGGFETRRFLGKPASQGFLRDPILFMRVDIGGIEEVNTSEVVKAYLEKTMPIPLGNMIGQ